MSDQCNACRKHKLMSDFLWSSFNRCSTPVQQLLVACQTVSGRCHIIRATLTALATPPASRISLAGSLAPLMAWDCVSRIPPSSSPRCLPVSRDANQYHLWWWHSFFYWHLRKMRPTRHPFSASACFPPRKATILRASIPHSSGFGRRQTQWKRRRKHGRNWRWWRLFHPLETNRSSGLGPNLPNELAFEVA